MARTIITLPTLSLINILETFSQLDVLLRDKLKLCLITCKRSCKIKAKEKFRKIKIHRKFLFETAGKKEF